MAQAYQAACTPDFFLFDSDGTLVYRGQLDDSRPGNAIPVSGKDLRAAIDAVLAGKPVASTRSPSIGCNIKWKPGNEPVLRLKPYRKPRRPDRLIPAEAGTRPHCKCNKSVGESPRRGWV